MNAPSVLSALLAGLLSFLSPCVLPLVPAYVSFISGISAEQLKDDAARGRVIRSNLGLSLSFVLGFTLVFAVMGVAFSGGARMLQSAGLSRSLEVTGGVLVILLGTNVIFDFIGFLRIDSRPVGRFSGKKIANGVQAALLGMSFAAGWSPCIGPLLASILFMAGQSGSALRAFFLLLAYSAGLGVPFLLTGLFFEKARPVIGFFNRHARQIRIVSGFILIVEGIGMALGRLGNFPAQAASLGYRLSRFTDTMPGLAQGIDLAMYATILFLAGRHAMLSIKQMNTGRPRNPGAAEDSRDEDGSAPAHAPIKRTTWARIIVSMLTAAAAVTAAILELSGTFSLLGLLTLWLGSGFTPRRP